MKRLLSICLLILCLSLPVIAGHTVSGGWCECGSPGCICDPGETIGNRVSVPAKPKPKDVGPETLLALVALILVLRYKA